MANPGPAVEGSTMTLSAVAPGVGQFFLPFYLALASVVNNTDLATAAPFTFKGRIIALDFITHAKVTTTAKAATLTPKIVKSGTATAVTGGVLALTSALATPEGTVIQATPITALNSFNRGDGLTLSWTAVTAFSEGTGLIRVTLVNDDTNDAVARGQIYFNP
jgi:hypothetical protein